MPWIEDCFRSHPACSNVHGSGGSGGPHEPFIWSAHAAIKVPPPDMKPNLPPRVLDIGPPWSNDYISLIETNGAKFHYVALTYSWGKVEVYKTTANNIQAHKLGISTRRMNRTFTDAIDIARRLGFRYLWIDALCILQGSDDDWNRHTHIMNDISANSTLISEHKHLTFVKMPYLTREGTPGGNYYLRWPAEHIVSQAVDGELSKRGWCLQERILSRRLLHMGSMEMEWECRTRFRRENDFIWDSSRKDLWDGQGEEDPGERDCQPWEGSSMFKVLHLGEIFSTGALSVSELGEIIDSREPGRLKKKGWSSTDRETTGPVEEIYDAWYRMVQDYCRREITIESDRLPAIASIAQKFAAITHDAYVGGLWANDLASGLLWERGVIATAVDPSVNPSAVGLVLKTPRVKRASSWSWLALDGPKCFASLTTSLWPWRRNQARIFDFEFMEEKSDGKGSGRMDNTILTFSGVVDTLEALTGWKINEDNIGKDDYAISLSSGPEHNGRIVLDAPENDPLEALKDTLYLLPVNITIPHTKTILECLLLHYVGPNNSFKRVGMGVFDYPGVFSLADTRLPQRRITLV